MTPPLTRLTVDRVIAARDSLGESPLWHPEERALYWTDITGRAFNRYSVAEGHARWPTPEAVGSFAAASSGFVAACESGFAWLVPAEETLGLEAMADFLAPRAELRMNDGRCDRAGRFWASSIAWRPDLAQPVGRLHRLELDGSVTDIIGGLVIPNGLAFSPDGATMYLADSHPAIAKVWAFDLAEDGTPSRRRLFLDFAGIGGRPDGAAIDTDGAYWVAATDAGRILRFTPRGKLDIAIPVPPANPTMVAFGGDDLRTVFVTSLRRPGTPDDGLAGGLFAFETGHQGLPDAVFGSRL